MTPEQAADLAARTLAAIERQVALYPAWPQMFAADRERVASDLAGLRTHIPSGDPDYGCEGCGMDNPCDDERRYADGLRRTALLYGVTERCDHGVDRSRVYCPPCGPDPSDPPQEAP